MGEVQPRQLSRADFSDSSHELAFCSHSVFSPNMLYHNGVLTCWIKIIA